MTSVVCNVPVLSQNDSTYHHSVFTTWKWHPFATWTPSFIILVWGHYPPLRRTVLNFACLQNCYNSCISCSRSALRYDSINSNLMNYSWTNGRLAIPSTSWASCIIGYRVWLLNIYIDICSPSPSFIGLQIIITMRFFCIYDKNTKLSFFIFLTCRNIICIDIDV